MMQRATRILRFVQQELERRDRALEVDTEIQHLDIRIFFDPRTREPIKLVMNPRSVTDLTERDR